MQAKTTLKDFDLLKTIGQGSYAKVYKAQRKSDKKICALKVTKTEGMKQSAIENTLNEIRLLSSIDSPFVVSYKEAFTENNNRDIVVVMEFVGGGDLASKIKEASKNRLLFGEETVWRYLCQALLGLQTLHRMKVVHRDIKSANLFLSEDGDVIKLGDLNIAKVLKEDLTSTQIGSPSYLAPEVWNNEKYSYNCDVFSLGCVLYEMAALKLPFEATSMNDLYRKITTQTVLRLPNRYSDELNSVIRLMLTKQPKMRPFVDELLENKLVKLKMREYKLVEKFSMIEAKNMLLETLRLPSNFAQLNNLLPKYKKEQAPRASSAKSRREINPEPDLSRKLIDLNRQIEEIEQLNRANVNFVPDFGKNKAPVVDAGYNSLSKKQVEVASKKSIQKPNDSLLNSSDLLKGKPVPPKKLPPPKPQAVAPAPAPVSKPNSYLSNNPRTEKAYDFNTNRSSIEQRKREQDSLKNGHGSIKSQRSNSLGMPVKSNQNPNSSFRDKNSSAMNSSRADQKTEKRPSSVQMVKLEDFNNKLKNAPSSSSSYSKQAPKRVETPKKELPPPKRNMQRVSSSDPKRKAGYF